MTISVKKQTAAQAYLDGISKGQAFLQDWRRKGGYYLPELSEYMLENIAYKTDAFDASSPSGQMLLGECAFWINKMAEYHRNAA